MVPFSSGDVFSSFHEFVQLLKELEDATNALFVLRSSKRLKDPVYEETIKYEFVVFECKHGERRHKSESKGIRPNQRSFKQGCTAKIRLSAEYKDGTCKLRISTCLLEHTNHIVEPEVSTSSDLPTPSGHKEDDMDPNTPKSYGFIEVIEQLQHDLQREQEKNRQIRSSIEMLAENKINVDELMRRVELINDLTSKQCSQSCPNCTGSSKSKKRSKKSKNGPINLSEVIQVPIIHIIPPYAPTKKARDMTKEERRKHLNEVAKRWHSTLTPEQKSRLRERKHLATKRWRLKQKAKEMAELNEKKNTVEPKNTSMVQGEEKSLLS